MGKNCIYCKSELSESSVIDFCERCGHSVWGEKMFKAIVTNMESAQSEGNLNQGSITDSMNLAKDFDL